MVNIRITGVMLKLCGTRDNSDLRSKIIKAWRLSNVKEEIPRKSVDVQPSGKKLYKSLNKVRL